MKIISTSITVYQLQNDDGSAAGCLTYLDSSFSEVMLSCDKEYFITKLAHGIWVTKETGTDIQQAMCEVKTGGTMVLLIHNKQYTFKKPFSWKLRLTMLNDEKEEVLAFLPTANWKIHSYNYVLQLNDEYSKETGSFVILQALHCAVCSMNMMNGFISSAIFG
jgi:hypothetical protein